MVNDYQITEYYLFMKKNDKKINQKILIDQSTCRYNRYITDLSPRYKRVEV